MTFRSFDGTRDLYGVAKTLRKLYPPQHEPSLAIERALEALAFLEARRSKIGRRPALASVA
ncbi:protein of unknown function [Beijerinckiaceae bacterium RH AL1]|jgi:hypothetical protein|nr:hypothetical protein [Beijerinckiaceae bacterium]VVB43057.1 protein of unknown function [Beijerinckiaceae bacterium RH AL8]VVB43070.1 protein of unknown function [Beijerinckiaceae bacterium RH CH11]VVC53646.1 protein of unknown function [Beijerinckiaceae bacterium RH AL1]